MKSIINLQYGTMCYLCEKYYKPIQSVLVGSLPRPALSDL